MINEILSGSLQTLSEDDLRPMSEAIENMDSIKTNLDVLQEGVSAAEQIEKVYDQYNEIVLCDKALIYQNACGEFRDLQKKTNDLQQDIERHKEEETQESEHLETLQREEEVLQEEWNSLADSDAAKLKDTEEKLRMQQKTADENSRQKKQQEEEKNQKLRETELMIRESEERSDGYWRQVEKALLEMEEETQEIPYDDIGFLKKELMASKGESYQFLTHVQTWKDYCNILEQGKEKLQEEYNCRERYSKAMEDLDRSRRDVDQAERILRQHENQLHETKQELIEKIYSWNKDNQEIRLEDDGVLRDMNRNIDGYQTSSDYWAIRNLWKPAYEMRERQLSRMTADQEWKIKAASEELQSTEKELQNWIDRLDPEPECDEATTASRKALDEKNIPYLPFYKIVDFDTSLSEEVKGMLEEALLRMGVLDALIISSQYREQVMQMDPGLCDKYLFTDAAEVQTNLMTALHIDEEKNSILLYQTVSSILSSIGWNGSDAETWIDAQGNYKLGILEGTVTKQRKPKFIGTLARLRYREAKIRELQEKCAVQKDVLGSLQHELEQLQECSRTLNEEWMGFPKEGDLKLAAREYERQEEKLDHLQDIVQMKRESAEEERKQLDTVSMKVQEVCTKCNLKASLEVFRDVLDKLQHYGDLLRDLQIYYANYVKEMEQLTLQKNWQEELEQDLDEIRYESGKIEEGTPQDH